MYRVKLKSPHAKQQYIERTLVYRDRWTYFTDLTFLGNFRDLVIIEEADNKRDFMARDRLLLDEQSQALDNEPVQEEISESVGTVASTDIELYPDTAPEVVEESASVVDDPIDYSTYTVKQLKAMIDDREDIDSEILKTVTLKADIIQVLIDADFAL